MKLKTQNTLKKWIAFFAVIVMTLSLTITDAYAATVSIPNPTEMFYVNDFAKQINSETAEHIVSMSSQLNDQTGAQIVITTIDYTGNNVSMADYATAMFDKWGIGDAKKANGFLLVLSIGDDNYYESHGKAYEQIIGKKQIKNYLDTILEPYFAEGDYDTGVRKFYDKILEETNKFYKVSQVEGQMGQIDPNHAGGVDTGDGTITIPGGPVQTETAPNKVTSIGTIIGSIFSIIFTILIWALIIYSIYRIFRGPRVGSRSRRGNSYYFGTPWWMYGGRPRRRYDDGYYGGGIPPTGSGSTGGSSSSSQPKQGNYRDSSSSGGFFSGGGGSSASGSGRSSGNGFFGGSRPGGLFGDDSDFGSFFGGSSGGGFSGGFSGGGGSSSGGSGRG